MRINVKNDIQSRGYGVKKTYVLFIATIAVMIVTWNATAEQTAYTTFAASPQIRMEIDRRDMRNQLIRGSFEKWVRVSPTSNGYFKSSVNRRWKAKSRQRSHLISQTRLLYVMAQAYEVTRQSKYLKALKKGADFLLRYYAASREGTWYWRVSSKGRQLSDEETYLHFRNLIDENLNHGISQHFFESFQQSYEQQKQQLYQEIVRQIILEARDSKNIFLDLSELELTSIPNELRQMSYLQ